jgi:hypothetical protein
MLNVTFFTMMQSVVMLNVVVLIVLAPTEAKYSACHPTQLQNELLIEDRLIQLISPVK